MTALPQIPATTLDAFLGGRVQAVQPAAGHHRSGLEAALLGAALDRGAGGIVVDLGAGAGVAGLCAASRCPDIEVRLAERDPELTACARAALALPSNQEFAGRIRVAEIDFLAPEAERVAVGLPREEAAAVITNPPFHDSRAVTSSPSPSRAAAHVRADDFDGWLRVAAWTLAPAGILVVIVPAAGLPDLIAASSGRFARLCLLPVHSRRDLSAERVIIHATKGSRGALAILPGLVVHEGEGSAFTPALRAVLRDGAGLDEVHPAWREAAARPARRVGA